MFAVAVCAGIAESEATTLNVAAPLLAAEGVQETTPADESASPFTSELPVASAHFTAPVPPVEIKVAENCVPSTPSGCSHKEVTTRGSGLILMVIVAVAVWGALAVASVTWHLQVAAVTAIIGVPVRIPELLSVNPAGGALPEAMDHL